MWAPVHSFSCLRKGLTLQAIPVSPHAWVRGINIKISVHRYRSDRTIFIFTRVFLELELEFETFKSVQFNSTTKPRVRGNSQ